MIVCVCLDTDRVYYRLSMKYFDPDDLMLSVFFHIKKVQNQGEMWELKYVALGLREFAALIVYNKEKQRLTVKRVKAVATVKPTKQLKITSTKSIQPEEENDVIVLPSDEENY